MSILVKFSKHKIKENLEKAHNEVAKRFEVKIPNEGKPFDDSKELYISLDFTFPSLYIYGLKTPSDIYNYIAEYANKYSIKIVSISDIRKEEESNSSYVSVIFEKPQSGNP